MKLFRAFGLALTLMLTAIGIISVSAQGGDATRGAQLYAKNCTLCHGDKGQGRIGATLAKDFPALRVDAFLKETISNGVAGSRMPTWAKSKGGPLSDAEIDDIVAFVRTLSGPIAPTAPAGATATSAPLPSPAPNFPVGDSTRGAQVFATNCAACHGDRGEGRIGATLQKDFPVLDPEKFLDTTISRGVAGSKMPAWSKSAGGPLSDQEIADAAAFIRSLKPAAAPTQAAPQIPQGGAFGGWIAIVCVGIAAVVGLGALALGLAGSRKNPA
ncbi:MAG: c-type cytochrome [Chloroflexi bacterium]|nr:c-type cytochrome [Chloroflexota bacterium]